MRVRVLVSIVLMTIASLAVSWAAPQVGAAPSKGSGSGTSTTSGTSSKKSTTKQRASTSSGRRTHVVRSGDTVPSIARRYGVDADDVRAANGIVDDKLYLGARLIIDGSAAGSSSTTSASGSSSTGSTAGAPATKRISSTTGGSTHKVKDGDYLAGIASKHGVSLSALLKANDLRTDSLILPGDSLVLPSSSSSSSSSSSAASSTSKGSGSGTSAGSVGPDIRCPIPGASFMNDWGFPRDEGTRFHEGTDLFAPAGTTIVAPAGGTVVFGTSPLGGHTFTLTTSGGWVFYGAHLSKAIGSSRQVGTGEAIARVGSSGNAAGGATHLHLGIKRAGGSPINPYPVGPGGLSMNWRGRCAFVGVLAAVALGPLGACSDGDDGGSGGGATTTAAAERDRAITTPDGQVTLLLDGELPANWPADVPLPPGSTVAGSGSLSGATTPNRVAVFTTDSDPEDAWGWYSSNTDLRTANPSSVGTGSAFVGTVEVTSPLSLRVTVVPGGDGSYVIVTVPGSGAPDETTTTAGTASTTSTVPGSIPSTTSPNNVEGGPA